MSTFFSSLVTIRQPVGQNQREALARASTVACEPELDIVFYSCEEVDAALDRARERLAPGDYERLAGMVAWLERWCDLMADPDITLAQMREELGVR